MSFSSGVEVNVPALIDSIQVLLTAKLSRPEFAMMPTADGGKVSIRDFIRRTLRRADVPNSCLVVAYIVLKRFFDKHPKARCKESSAHRLFLTSLIIGAKTGEDETYTNQSWHQIAEHVPLQDINNCEIELLTYLGFVTYVSGEEYASVVAGLRDIESNNNSTATPMSITMTSSRGMTYASPTPAMAALSLGDQQQNNNSSLGGSRNAHLKAPRAVMA